MRTIRVAVVIVILFAIFYRKIEDKGNKKAKGSFGRLQKFVKAGDVTIAAE